VTDTDLFTADDSTENEKLSSSVTTDTSAGPEASEPAVDAKRNVPDGSLSTMVLPELRALANRVGVKGASGMRKNELITAIRESQGHANGAPSNSGEGDKSDNPGAGAAVDKANASADEATGTERRTASREAGSPNHVSDQDSRSEKTDQTETGKPKRDQQDTKPHERESEKGGDDRESDKDQLGAGGQQNRGGDDDSDGRGGRRGRRFRERRRRGERSGDGEAELREDDVVQPVAGILDVLDNYAFVRTSGYLAGPHDVYVSMNMVRKNGLRRGDAVTGAVRVPKDGEQPNQRQKFNPLVRLDSVNGGPVEDAKKRPEFGKLTPLYPNERLRLETATEKLTTRVIDLIMPIGKGQRALIVSPPKAGKTTILQDTANAIAKNNPECHLMVVLVDERPEEVTDMQRSVKGEVIASTFDRPPSDHTSVAELAIERAKRLVEQGKDVVVLLDSITRLGRAYNNASPASGRILSGGVDSTALYPPKRFLGAARNIEEGGSLTIIATAMVETGSTGDTVIFEEFKGTGNAELKLDRKISERRVFPAVDVNPSGTRKDELLLSPDEFAIVHKLRRVLSGLDSHQAIDLLMSQLRKTKNNYEFLVQVSKTTPGMDND
jgi:transcription termination factor Rho